MTKFLFDSLIPCLGGYQRTMEVKNVRQMAELQFSTMNKSFEGAAVVAQLVKQLLLFPEVLSSNPIINKVYIAHLLSTVLKRRK